ncbi:helix-turn-helix domain-containing protein [Amycolatopsis sp. PS_44_ISF1]|uniref:helix-turn-helix domain-containing protein n=1 Tax=Amycolatopsis sp. PS_44_ISF1 TaxID=2974917 RepID=UPI0028E3AAA7|nr:helix-turn-helix domain-containing protein [Amycolatopsis sp. PS_44_ISF1]
MVVLALARGNTVPTITRLVQGGEDTIRGVIHRFNEAELASLDPRWAGGRPRLISPEDEALLDATATTRLKELKQPFTRWRRRRPGGNGCGSSCASTRSASSIRRPERYPTTRTGIRSWPGPGRSPAGSRIRCSPSTSSVH